MVIYLILNADYLIFYLILIDVPHPVPAAAAVRSRTATSPSSRASATQAPSAATSPRRGLLLHFSFRYVKFVVKLGPL